MRVELVRVEEAGRGALTACARLIALVDVGLPSVDALLLEHGFVLAGDGEVGAVEGTAVEHERGLGRGRLLEVDGREVLFGVELDGGDLAAEPKRGAVSCWKERRAASVREGKLT